MDVVLRGIPPLAWESEVVADRIEMTREEGCYKLGTLRYRSVTLFLSRT